ncbi:MAG TPA: alanine racemase [Nocardioides sp.]|uniref:alanine racemase n=1 Tax=Nocardioides sp. TaxID=35761 RepID=UPI002E314A8A|nr:alanine racemase [Nocardioides sp.]HEX3930324.1 alanine racemase [Nocardioides sp.]
MSLTLTVDGDRWRRHLREVADRTAGLTPVAKGNGYGFGLGRLARKAEWLGADTIAVGTYEELPEVAQRFPGDLLVLTPWRPTGSALPEGLPTRRVIHTVSRLSDLLAILEVDPDARVVLERMTSMRRHGMAADELRSAAGLLDRRPARVEGVALHLPLAAGVHLREVLGLVNDVVASGLATRRLWVSHLTSGELASLRTSYADFEVRPRVGTELWLGDRGALRVTATVLDVHEVERGDVFGYRGRSVPKAGHIVVVSGGTAHGIGLEAPTGDHSIRARAASLARGGLDAAGFVRSPFTIDGKQRLFAEPPHMQASMLFLPHGPRVPVIGDEVEVRVRYTTTGFDHVVLV